MQALVYMEEWEREDEGGGVRVGGNAFRGLQEVKRPAELVGGQSKSGRGCPSDLPSAKTNTLSSLRGGR